MQGELSLHGTTPRPVQLQISGLDCGAPVRSRLCRFSGAAQIRRSDFGLPHGFFAGGDEVEISVNGVGLP